MFGQKCHRLGADFIWNTVERFGDCSANRAYRIGVAANRYGVADRVLERRRLEERLQCLRNRPLAGNVNLNSAVEDLGLIC